MTIPRVFVSYASSDRTQHADQFTTRLINDLRAAGADVVVDEASSINDDLAQSLNQVLPNCHWLVLVQTPAALHSPRVQLAVNTALNLVVKKRMRAILPVIAVPYDPQEVPATWATLNTYDATQDYQRALMRILLVLGLSPLPNGKEAAPLTRSHDSLLPSSMDRLTASPEQSFTTSAKFSSSSLDRPTSLPTLPAPTRRKRRQWFTALAVAAVLVLIIAGVAVAANPFSSRHSPIPTATIHITATATATATPQTTPTATATATPNSITKLSIDVNCTSTGQLCNPPFTTTVKTNWHLKIEYINTNCSSLRLHVFIDGQEVITTGFLRWSLGWTGREPSQFATLPLSTGILDLSPGTAPGQHVLGLQAEGQVSGCNTSGVGGWIGTLYIYT